ncbi:MAG TPA: hypothetical protein VN903_24345 [Polyangia bacterium]|jgi:hypothetical protein|nr:hypothetical protein [Polyangia bacterium]
MQTSLAPKTQPLSQPTEPGPPFESPRLSWFTATLLALGGILLPALTLLVESQSHMCAKIFFDPLPTVGHVFALAAVPLANLVSLWVLVRRDGARVEAVIFAQAVAVAISAAYAARFAPITPMAIYGVTFYGLGLLPLSPLLSLFAGLRTLLALRRLRRALGRPAHRAVLGGFAAGIGVLIALNLPLMLTGWTGMVR